MLSIYVTTEHLKDAEQYIAQVDRLNELVSLIELTDEPIHAQQNHFLVQNGQIRFSLDWQQFSPPILFSNSIPFQEDIFLGVIFSLLGNLDQAVSYLQENLGLFQDFLWAQSLTTQEPIEAEHIQFIDNQILEQSPEEQFRLEHNKTMLLHYGHCRFQIDASMVHDQYLKTLSLATNPDLKAFTTFHFAGFFLDQNHFKEAESVILNVLGNEMTKPAQFALQSLLIRTMMGQLTIPIDPELVANLKQGIWETLTYFESLDRFTDSGMLLLDAAHIASISESFSESLGYIQKAIRYFEKDGLNEWIGNAQMYKGRLMYTWAQNGNPQFFRPATEAYQEALKVFTKDSAPAIFAEIQHQLGLLYAEMPDEVKKKSIWAGVSVASFQEALDFYSKENYPYEYAMICNNYGNALCKYPQAVHSDNYEKALFYYQESLSIRTAEYPYERALTLLNFLEASWNVSNSDKDFNTNRFKDMQAKANEIANLVEDSDLIEAANRHIQLLKSLNQAVVGS